MKVKVLNATLEAYWYSNSIGEEFDVIYVIKDRDNTYRQTDKPRYIRNVDSVITELPESFCVKSGDDKKWDKYIQWLNKTYFDCYMGRCDGYYGSLEGGGCYEHVSFGTEIHIDDMIKHIDYMERLNTNYVDANGEPFVVGAWYKLLNSPTVEYRKCCKLPNNDSLEYLECIAFGVRKYSSNYGYTSGLYRLRRVEDSEIEKFLKKEVNMETQTLSRKGLKEIHEVACLNWKMLLKQYGLRNPLEDYIELTQEEVNQMFDACTKDQLPIVSKYLKKEDNRLFDFNKVRGTIQRPDGQELIGKRVFGKFDNKSFYLHKDYDWEIKKDDLGESCLIPNKKK